MKRPLTRKRRDCLEKVRNYLASNRLAAGDQLPGIAHLANVLSLNTRMVQTVYELFEEEGWVESIPKTGTFARVPFSSVVSGTEYAIGRNDNRAGVDVVRMYVQEYEEYTGTHWRELIRAFEKRNPLVRVELTMTLDPQLDLPCADILHMECRQIQELHMEGRRFLECFEPPSASDFAEMLRPVSDFLLLSQARWLRPTLLGMPVLLVDTTVESGIREKRISLTPCSLVGECIRILEGKRDRFSGGLCLFSYTEMLHWLGWMAKSWDEVRGVVESYANVIASEPPPRLVTYSERGNYSSLATNQDWLWQILSQQRVVAAVVPLWYASHLDAGRWRVLPSPFTSGASIQIAGMAAAVCAGTRVPAASVELVRFMTSREGQKIISRGGCLPIRSADASNHPFWHACRENLRNGYQPDSLVHSPSTREPLRRIETIFHDLRTRRLSTKEALATIGIEWENARKAGMSVANRPCGSCVDILQPGEPK